MSGTVDTLVAQDAKGKDKETKDDTPEKIEKMTPEINVDNLIFSILGSARILLVKQVHITFSSTDVPIASISGMHEIVLKRCEKLEPNWKVWIDEVSHSRYFVGNSVGSFKFNSYSELLALLIKDYDQEVEYSKTYMAEPKREMIATPNRVYPPELVGFPLREALYEGIRDDNARRALSTICAPVPIDDENRFVLCGSFEYGPRAQTRERLIAFARGRTARNRDTWQRVIEAMNLQRSWQIQNMRELRANEIEYPTWIFNERIGIFDYFPRSAVYIRTELYTKLMAFELKLDPISSSEIMKENGIHMNRASFINDIVGVQYDPEMGTEISAWCLSLMDPGAVLLELEWDESTKGLELRAMIVAFMFGLIMYDENSSWNNVTKRTLIAMQRAICEFGGSKQILDVVPGVVSDWPLDHVRLRNGPNNSLDPWRVVNGVCGLLARQRNLADDRLAQFWIGISERRNYVMDYDDYREFDRHVVNLNSWYMNETAFEFFSRCGKRECGTMISSCLSRLLKCIIRINEYLSIEWYCNFRVNAAAFNARNHNWSEANALRVLFKSRTAMFFLRSVDGNEELKPRVPYVEALKAQCDLLAAVGKFYTKYIVVNRFVREVHIANEFSGKERFLMAVQTEFEKYLSDLILYSDEASRIWVARAEAFINGTVGACFAPLYERTLEDFVTKGLITRVIVNVQCNTITRAMIDDLIRERRCYTNQDAELPGDIRIDGGVLRRLVQNRSWDSTWNSSNVTRLILELPLSYELVHTLPRGVEQELITYDRNASRIDLKSVVKFKSVPVYIASVNPDRFAYEDDYYSSGIIVTSSRVPNQEFNRCVIPMDEFLGNLGRYASTISMFIEPAYEWKSISESLPKVL